MLLSFGQPLSGLSRENWRSTIRRYVTVHPEYADMGEWTGTGTSSIEYYDEGRTLTVALELHNYLEREFGPYGRQPLRYYIWVKTTPGPCDTPFSISDAEYEKVNPEPNPYIVAAISKSAVQANFRSDEALLLARVCRLHYHPRLQCLHEPRRHEALRGPGQAGEGGKTRLYG